MDATCAIQNSIHVFSLVHINMCPGFWVHINLPEPAFLFHLLYSLFPRPCLTFIKFLSEHFATVHRTDQHDKKDRKIYVFLH